MAIANKYATPNILNSYAAFLFSGGLGGFLLSGIKTGSLERSWSFHSLFAGASTASLVALCGYLTKQGTPVVEGDGTYKKFMIGVHLGILLPPIYAGLFSWRAINAIQNPAKPRYLGVLFSTLAVGSIITEYFLYTLKPKNIKKAK
mmetsp:Transcript_11236/g.14522  ORF Transcript_11236/g.14522 Transcript_11236/m.14522 type:complete len:146 (+) Transcript_11236:95-532(+)